MKKISKIVRLAANPSILRFLIAQYDSGYLKDIGWFNSFQRKDPVDSNLAPLPWVTYPFIDFIESRLADVHRIFEYGSGNSTLYYARFVAEVVSVEHDYAWYEKIRQKIPSNVTMHFSELIPGGEYCNFSRGSSDKFDLIIVDGRDRVNCVMCSVESLTDGGAIVLDDSERERYGEAVEFLIGKGFKRLDFWGVSPGLFYKKCTTIFYRDNNVLGI